MTLTAYITTVEAITGAPLSPDEAEWLFNARKGGIKPRTFAGWINLMKPKEINRATVPLPSV